jgi:methyl-accepting chemotaxis protein
LVQFENKHFYPFLSTLFLNFSPYNLHIAEGNILSDNKITVNDALISTDVDSLIRTISEKKKVDLHELVNICKMDRRSIEKWVRVLEDEGYISINYGLRGTTVSWLGEETEAKTNEKEIDEVLSDIPTDSTPEDEEPQVVDSSAYIDPEKRLEQYLRKKSELEEVNDDNLKSNILGSLDEEQDNEFGPDENPEEVVEEEEAKPEEIPEPPKPPMITKPKRIDSGEKSSQVKELLNAYINQINEEKAELEKLKTEKDRVYRENYLALESKVEADIASITEKILEKEGRILEMKERVAQLPSKVNEVGAIHESVKKLEEDGREVLSKTKESVDEFIAKMQDTRDQLGSQIKETREVVEAEKLKVNELSELSNSVEEQAANLDSSIELTKSQMDKLNEQLKTLLDELEEATEMKVEVSDMVDRVRGSIEEKESELNDLESQIDEIEQVEKWAREYVVDYQRKIDEIGDYIAQSEDEISALSEQAESEYINKYLNELDNMSSAYDSLINDATDEEQEIDEKIRASKNRLASLVKDSKNMVKKLRSDHSVDFASTHTALAKRSGRMLQMIEEKESERAKLSEDIENARSDGSGKTKPVASKKKKKPRKKSSKKKGKKK